MNYRRFEHCDMTLSEIGFGCWQLSGPKTWSGSNDKDSISAVHFAMDIGINFFDVAPVYGLAC